MTNRRRVEFWSGVRATIPLVVGAIPFGLIFGALAVANGLTPVAAGAMSALVYAGSAQFIAAGLVASEAGAGVIVFTTLVVNLRHILYAVSLAPQMRALPQWLLALIGFWLTDETYAVAIGRYHQADRSPYRHWFYLGSALFMYGNWQLATWLGVWVGRAIADPQRWGLDFAFIATFIGIVTPTVRSRPLVACVVAAGAGALLLRELPYQLGLVAGALVGVLVGIGMERASRDRRPERNVTF